MNPSPSSKLSALQSAAQRARSAYLWEEAITHYTAALNLPDLSPEDEYTLRDGRAYSHQRMAQFQDELADLEKMVDLAGGETAGERYLDAFAHQAVALVNAGRLEEAAANGERLLAIAQKANLPFFIGEAHKIVGLVHMTAGRFLPASEAFSTALDIFKDQDALAEEVWTASYIAFCALFLGQDLQPYAQRILEIARQLNDPLLEARAYHALCWGLWGNQLLYRSYLEKALEIYRLINERRGVNSMLHNLGEFYLDYGLYRRAYSYYQQSLQIMEETASPVDYLSTLSRVAWSGFHRSDRAK